MAARGQEHLCPVRTACLERGRGAFRSKAGARGRLTKGATSVPGRGQEPRRGLTEADSPPPGSG